MTLEKDFLLPVAVHDVSLDEVNDYLQELPCNVKLLCKFSDGERRGDNRSAETSERLAGDAGLWKDLFEDLKFRC